MDGTRWMEFLPVFSFGGQNTEHGDPLFVGQQNGSSSISSQLANRISSWQQQLLITQTSAAAASSASNSLLAWGSIGRSNCKLQSVPSVPLWWSVVSVWEGGGAIRNYKVSHHHLPAPTHAWSCLPTWRSINAPLEPHKCPLNLLSPPNPLNPTQNAVEQGHHSSPGSIWTKMFSNTKVFSSPEICMHH